MYKHVSAACSLTRVITSEKFSSRNGARVKRGASLGQDHEGSQIQWEYWNFAGDLDGDLLAEYGEGGGVGFDGRLHDAIIEGPSLEGEIIELPAKVEFQGTVKNVSSSVIARRSHSNACSKSVHF